MYRFLIPMLFLAAFAVTPALGAYDLTIEPVCTAPGDQLFPAISGDIIVWVDGRDPADYNIYMYDPYNPVLTGEPICTAPGNQNNPAISGNTVVWEDKRSGDRDIYMINLANPIPNGEPVFVKAEDQIFPVIAGNIIVWQDSWNGDWELYMYDLSDPVPDGELISTNGAVPVISGDIIVWHDFRNGNWDIYMYDLSHPVPDGEPVYTEAHAQMSPAISGDIIAWEDFRDGNADIYMYDLSNPGAGAQAVCTEEHDQRNPSISGDIIVWEDYRNGNPDIFMYDLSQPVLNGEPVCIDTSGQGFPAIYGNIIAWQDNRNGNLDIYMATLSKSTPLTMIDITVDSFSVPGGVYTPGDPVTATAEIWNNGDTTSITVEYEVRNVNGDITPVFSETFSIPAHTTKTYSAELTWTVPQDAPAGDYDALIRVYRAGNLANVYDSEILPDVFRVVHDQPLNEIDITVDSFSVQQGTYTPGDPVTASAQVCNNAGNPLSVWVNYAIRDPEGSYYEPLKKAVTVPSQTCISFDNELEWTVPADATAGFYDAMFSVYSPGDPPETYDVDWSYDALIVGAQEDEGNGTMLIFLFGGLIVIAAVLIGWIYYNRAKKGEGGREP